MNNPLCPYCGRGAALVSDAEVYGGRSFGRQIWLCRGCDAYVGCHEGTNKPLGTPANAALREARGRAHLAFDPLWKTGRMTRTDAYKLLATHLGIRKAQCHIAHFDLEMCRKVYEGLPALR